MENKKTNDADVSVAAATFSRIEEAVASGDEQQINDVIDLLDQQPINVRQHIFSRGDTEDNHSLLGLALNASNNRLLEYALEQSAKTRSLQLNINGLIHNIDPHDTSVKRRAPPLWLVVNRQKVDMVALLLTHGADVNVCCQGVLFTNEEVSPLLMSLRVRPATEVSRRITEMLLEHGADATVVSKSGVTAAMLAARYHPNLLPLILARLKAIGCDATIFVNLQDDNKRTALHYAARAGVQPNFDTDFNVVSSLCNEGCDWQTQDINGHNALMSCCAHLWHPASKWTPQHVQSRVNDLMTFLQMSQMEQWQVWELVGAEVALATRWHRDHGNDVQWSWFQEWQCVDIWQQALSIRQQLCSKSIPVWPLPICDASFEPVTMEALEQLRDNWRATLEHALQVRRRHLGDESFVVSRSCVFYSNYLKRVAVIENEGPVIFRCCLLSLKARPSLADMKIRVWSLLSGQMSPYFHQFITQLLSALNTCVNNMKHHHTDVRRDQWEDYLQVVRAAVHVATLLHTRRNKSKIMTVVGALDCCINKLNDAQIKDLLQIINKLIVHENPDKVRSQQVLFQLLEDVILNKERDMLLKVVRVVCRMAYVGDVSLNPMNQSHSGRRTNAPLYVCAQIITDPITSDEYKNDLKAVMEMLVDEGGAHWDAAHQLLTANRPNIADVTRTCTVAHHFNTTAVARYISLQCLAARVVRRHVTGYQHELHRQLAEFVSMH